MNALRRIWNLYCGLSLSDRGLWFVGVAVFALLLGLILVSDRWSPHYGLINNLDYAAVEILGTEIKLKYFALFSLSIGFAGLSMFFAGLRSTRQ
jgi:hypothetical protein